MWQTKRTAGSQSSVRPNRFALLGFFVLARSFALYGLHHFLPGTYLLWRHLTGILVMLRLRALEQPCPHDIPNGSPFLVGHLAGQTPERLADYSDGDVTGLRLISKEVSADFLESFFLSSADSWEDAADISHMSSSDANRSRTSGLL